MLPASRRLCATPLQLFKVSLLRPCSSAKGDTTPLYDFHVERGGKIVNFGGFLLPVYYSDQGIAASHLHTRKSASLFDVSHMLQTEIIGPDAIRCLESVCTADLINLPLGSSTLTVFTKQDGGVLDDLIVTKIQEDHFYVVSNAALRHQDRGIILKACRQGQGPTVKFFEPHERALLALQGPRAAQVLQKHTDLDLSKMYFMTSSVATVCGVEACRLTRCGYTGEDGFEVSIPGIKAVDVTRALLTDDNIKLAGLGARDSLRLEAGLCLYGNDLTQDTSPVEAALTWLIQKRRRSTADFPGSEVILRQIKEGVAKKRVGLIAIEAGPPARHGTSVVPIGGGAEVGVVTSGCPAPSLANRNIAMAYLPTELSRLGTEVAFKVRDRVVKARVSKMPFVPSNYYAKPK